MYPKNAATPPRIAIGAVVQISDGAVQTSGVSIKVKPEGGSASAGGGTTTYEEGIVAYVPTQAETNYTAFQVIAYKTGCIPVAATVVTTDTATAGRVTVSGTKSTLDSLNDIAATAIVSGGAITTSGGAVSSVTTVTGNVGGNVAGSVASVTAGVTLADGPHGGSSATLSLSSISVSNSSGTAVTMQSTGGDGAGLYIQGNGAGNGMTVSAGSSGVGLQAVGGSSSGDGAQFVAQASGDGAKFISYGAGDGLQATGSGGGYDINADIQGSLSGSAGSVTGNVGGISGTIQTLDALDTAQDAQHSTTQSAISSLNDPTAAAIATDVWTAATRTLTAATSITSDGSAITMSSSGVVSTVNTVNTTTTNTDMRGTDSAFLAASAPANFSSLVVSAGGAVDSLVQGFINNTIAETTADNISANFETFFDNADALTSQTVDDVGSGGGGGIATSANQTTIINHLTDIKGTGFVKDTHSLTDITEDVTGLNGDTMRGTDNALLAASAPTNFSDLAVTATTGLVSVGTNNDKSGYTISGTLTTLDALDAAQDSQHSTTQSAVSSLNNLSTADIDARLAVYDSPTKAEMDAAFTEIKGATWDSSNSLEAIHDDLATVDGIADSILEDTGTTLPAAISAINTGAGSGARTVTVTVDDGTDPLQNASVRLTEGLNTYTASTNASGQATFNVDDATYTVAITKDGYTYAGTSLVITADATPTYSMTAIVITPAAGPGQTTGYLTARTSGVATSGVEYQYRQTTTPANETGYGHDPAWITVTSAENGLVEFPRMVKGAYYEYRRVSGGNTRSVTIPSAADATYELPSLV